MHLYGLIIGIAIIVGCEYFSRHQHFLYKQQENFFLIGLIVSAIVGARLYHVFDNWSYYSAYPWQIPETWNGGLGIFGALIGGYIFILFFIRNLKIKILNLFDAITPILPLCQAIGRLGNFVNHEIPTWWIEALANLMLFFVIKFSPKNPTAKYLIGYGLIRFFIEFFRYDTWTVNSVKIGQLISLIFIFSGIILLHESEKYPKQLS